jgi:hypothetical protein
VVQQLGDLNVERSAPAGARWNALALYGGR